MTGIYGFRNKHNNKWYIGQSIDINRRYNEHIKSKTTDINSFDYTLIKNINDFEFVILEECNKELLNQREEYYISKYNSNITGYNRTKGGSRFPDNYIYTEHHLNAIKNSWTNERKQKASETQHIVQTEFYKTEQGKQIAKEHSIRMTGRKQSDETKTKRNNKLKQVIHNEEWNKKVSESLKGKTISKETRQKLSESHKGKSPGNKGKKFVWNDPDDKSKGFHYE